MHQQHTGTLADAVPCPAGDHLCSTDQRFADSTAAHVYAVAFTFAFAFAFGKAYRLRQC